MKIEKESSLFTGKGENDTKRELVYFEGQWGIWWTTKKGEKRFKALSKEKEKAQQLFTAYEEQKKEREKNEQNTERKANAKRIVKKETNNENIPKLKPNTPPPDDEAEELKRIEEEKRQAEYQKKIEAEWEKLWNKLTSNQKGKVNTLLNTEAVQIKAGEKILNVIFTKDTIGKSLSKKFNSNGYILHWKRENIDKFPDILKCLHFDRDKEEEGKGVGIHNEAKRWYYFKGEYSDGKDTFIVNADIVDTGKQQILYLLKMKKKEPSKN